MKKLFLLLAMVGGLLFVSCEGFEQNDDNEDPNEQPGNGNNDNKDDGEEPEDIFFALDKQEILISPNGGSAEVVVYSNCAWSISTSCDWCSISPTSGQADDDRQKVTFTAGMTYETREAEVVFNYGGKTITLMVKQNLKEVIIADESNTFSVPAEGGTVELAYQTSVECEVIIPDEAKAWITIAPDTKGLVSEKVALNVVENNTYGGRSAVVKVIKKGDETLSAEYTITQAQNNAIVANEDNSFDVPAVGGTVELAYQANVECEVIIPDEAKAWIAIPTTRALSEQTTALAIANNATYEARSAVIKVVAVGNEALAIEYTITQEQNNAIIAGENNTFEVPVKGGNVEIAYQTNVECEVIIPDEAKEWISLAPDTRGLVSENVTLIVAENATDEARSALIKVVAVDDEELVAEYTIKQKPNGTLVADGNNTFEVAIDGGNVEIAYQTNVECDVVIPDEAAAWISLAPETRGLARYAVTLVVAGNNTGIDRSATVKVVAADNDELMAEYIINQMGSSYGIKYTSAGGDVVTPKEGADFGGANIISNTYENGVGSIKFDAPITEIGVRAFENCTSLTSITIPNSVTEVGNYAFSGCTSLANITIPDSVAEIGLQAFRNCSSLTSITIPDSIAKIGSYTFFGCSNLTSATLPDSIDAIGDYAFHGCTSLASITIPDSVTKIGGSAFSGCTSLTSITIPDNVTEIGYSALAGCTGELINNSNCLSGLYGGQFSKLTIGGSALSSGRYHNCTSLTSVTIGDNVTEIGGSAFDGCTSLTSITIGNSVTTIGEYAFYKCTSLTSITIPDSVTTIGNSAFSGCTSLTSITIGNSVTTIGNSAFYDCSSLTSITIPDSVTTIGNSAFDGCTSLTSITIGNSVTTIGNYAFYKCTSLASITIPDSVTSIGEFAFFYYCDSLSSVTIGDGITSIGRKAFAFCKSLKKVTIGDCTSSIGDYMFEGCTSLESVTIGNGITKIGERAFYECTSLASITIPNSVTEIGNSAFSVCRSLPSITIPDSVTEIRDYTFSGCTSLTSITIGNGITKIGNDAFYKCTSLTSITIPDSVTKIGEDAFSHCTSLANVNLGNGVAEIGYSAFNNCSFTDITIPASVTSIENYAFGGNGYSVVLESVNITDLAAWCNIDFSPKLANPVSFTGTLLLNGNKITDITIPSNVTQIKPYVFYNLGTLESVKIHDKVTSIGRSAFMGCSALSRVDITDLAAWCNIDFGDADANPAALSGNLFLNGNKITEVELPTNLTEIKPFVFSGCSFLTSITIPDGVTKIGESAFEKASITEVTIPASVEYIGAFAFANEGKLTTVKMLSPTPCKLGGHEVISSDGMFVGSIKYGQFGQASIYVPAESVDAYKTAEVWEYSSSKIYPLE